MRKIKQIILHHTASHRDKTTVADIARWHKERGLGDGCQYHYVIYGSGEIKTPKPISQIGHHCYGRNEHSVGVCLTGNFEVVTPTEAQFVSLRRVLEKLLKELKLTPADIVPHKEAVVPGRSTACPGINLSSRLKKLRTDLLVKEPIKPLTWWEEVIRLIRGWK